MIKPKWLHKSPITPGASAVRSRVNHARLNTVCRSARCPNMGECYSSGTATFLILGEHCTRECRFCAVPFGRPMGVVDHDEPRRVAMAAMEMGLSHVVVTSVTRDDLPDGGAAIFAETIQAIHALLPFASVEVLTPDFCGDMDAVDAVALAMPQVYNHNMETVRELYHRVRPQAEYERSLALLAHLRERFPALMVKSGFMLGLGETREQIVQLLQDLRRAGCQMVTIGQYLQPSKAHLSVVEYILPERFEELARMGEEMGFAKVFAGPFVRSSYMAHEALSGGASEVSMNGPKD